MVDIPFVQFQNSTLSRWLHFTYYKFLERQDRTSPILVMLYDVAVTFTRIMKDHYWSDILHITECSLKCYLLFYTKLRVNFLL